MELDLPTLLSGLQERDAKCPNRRSPIRRFRFPPSIAKKKTTLASSCLGCIRSERAQEVGQV